MENLEKLEKTTGNQHVAKVGGLAAPLPAPAADRTRLKRQLEAIPKAAALLSFLETAAGAQDFESFLFFFSFFP